uniref:Uncharacterized protein n=1 Tax=Rhizophora mucronata TaxID=61149 RepID=A0A2P2LHG5_RHIMU
MISLGTWIWCTENVSGLQIILPLPRWCFSHYQWDCFLESTSGLVV